MKILIIHLSDIHLKETGNHVLDKISQIPRALQNEETDIGGIAVVVSGDIANSGSEKEYALAAKELLAFAGDLKTRTRIDEIRFIFVPGNHDCDFLTANALRETVIAAVRNGLSSSIDHPTIEACCSVQSNYFQFTKNFPSRQPDTNHGSLAWDYYWPIGDKLVGFRCYNTAWFSQLKEQQGTLYYPENIAGVAFPTFKADYHVAVFHHPYNWMPATVGRRFRSSIEVVSDLVLTGHEHEPDHYQKYSFKGEVNEYLEGAVLQEHGEAHRSGFHAVYVDLTSQTERVVSFTWQDDMFVPSTLEKTWRAYTRGTRAGRKLFELKEDFALWLDDPGATYKHHLKLNLKLSDIFVFPNLRELQLSKKSESISGTLIEGRDLLKHIGTRNRLIFFARQQAGKTTLGKVLYRDYHNKGLTPVLIKGDDIGSAQLDLAVFEKSVETCFQSQYQGSSVAIFRQQDRDSVVLIIDDFDHVKLNSKGRLRLLNSLHKRYDRILILGDDVIKYEEIANGKESAEVLEEFHQLEILQFGHLLRSKLIEQWYSIGLEYVANPEEQARKQHTAEALITGLLGRNYLPSFPIYVLTLLQASESTQQMNSNVGTYGGLYEVLITQALAKTTKFGNLDLKNTYLSELGYRMFATNRRRFTDIEWAEFHTEYCRKFSISPAREGLRSEFIQSGLIDSLDNEYSFRHSYAYYYFVARYFRDNLTQEITRKTVESLCANLHQEEQASIWLFLTHLSKDPFLVDVIVKHARKIFAELTPARFEKDVVFLASLANSVEKIALEERAFEQSKEERLRALDDSPNPRELESASPPEDNTTETNEALRFLAQLTMALRTIEVLGQLVKNFPGSLIGDDKFTLVKECYVLGLRTVTALFGVFQTNADDFLKFVVDHVKAEHPDLIKSAKRHELEAKYKSVLFALIEGCAFGVVKRTSLAVGHTQLSATYAGVLKDIDSNAAHLIDMSIQLDNIGLPEDKAVALGGRFKDNVFCDRMLRQLLVHHFYLFPTSEPTKQKICQALGIPIVRLRTIDLQSKHTKKVEQS